MKLFTLLFLATVSLAVGQTITDEPSFASSTFGSKTPAMTVAGKLADLSSEVEGAAELKIKTSSTLYAEYMALFQFGLSEAAIDEWIEAYQAYLAREALLSTARP